MVAREMTHGRETMPRQKLCRHGRNSAVWFKNSAVGVEMPMV